VSVLTSVIQRLRALAPHSMTTALWSASAVLLTVALGGTWFTSPRALLVQEVRFEGNQRASDVALRHLVDVPNGTTHLGVSDDAVADGAEQHPWVREAFVRRTWHGLVVVVDEHRPVALAQLGEELFYVDQFGIAFLAARSDDLDYPIIAGLDANISGLHPSLERLVLRDAVALLSMADERGLVSLDSISEVVFTPSRGFTLHMRRGSEVLFGLSGHDAQLDRLSTLMDSGINLSTATYVDLAPARVAIVRPIASLGEG
jgi:hypothetical protein